MPLGRPTSMGRRRLSIILSALSSVVGLSILLQDSFLLRSQEYSYSKNPIGDLPYIGGWAAIEACRRGVDILFYIHTAPRNFAYRAVYRDTLAHAAMLGFWNATVVFAMGHTEDPTLAAWNHLEAEGLGDTVILPFQDSYANLIYKFTMGLRWMSMHCPNVKHVVKLDDDVSVRPVQLRHYLRKRVNPQDRVMHCFVWNQMHVYRDIHHISYVPFHLYPDSAYYPYCSGRFVIMPGQVISELYQMAFRIPYHNIDDAYVTGQLALAIGVGHENIAKKISFAEDKFEEVFLDKYILSVHFYAKAGSMLRRALWSLALMEDFLAGTDKDCIVRLTNTTILYPFTEQKVSH